MIEIRKMLPEDIPKIAVLYISLALYLKEKTKDPYFEFKELSEKELISRLEKDMQNTEKQIFVAAENDNVFGFIAGEIIDCFLPFSKINKVGYISAAYISEEHRNKGIMRNLEKTIMKFFQCNSLDYAELNVISNNFIGKKTWTKLGYTTFREHMRKKVT